MKISKTMTAAGVMVATLFGASVATASVYRVPRDYATIQDAVDDACDDGGGKVVIAAGTYDEAVDILDCQDLHIVGAGKGATVIDAAGEGDDVIDIEASQRVLIEKLAVTGGEDDFAGVCAGAGICICGPDVNTVKMQSIRSFDNDQDGIQDTATDGCTNFDAIIGVASPASGSAAGGVQISGSEVFGNGRDGVRLEGGGGLVLGSFIHHNGDEGVDLDSGGGHRVISNRIEDNNSQGVESDDGGNFIEGNRILRSGRDGVDTDEGDLVKGNLIAGSERYGVELNGNGSTIRQNQILTNGSEGIRMNSADQMVISNKIQWNGSSGIFVSDESGLFADKNVITNNDGDGIEWDVGEYNRIQRNSVSNNDGDGMLLYRVRSSLFFRNVVKRNAADGFDAGDAGDSEGHNTFEKNEACLNNGFDFDGTENEPTDAFFRNGFCTTDP